MAKIRVRHPDNAAPHRREWWDLIGMIGDFVGSLSGGGDHTPPPRNGEAPSAPVEEDVIVVTGRKPEKHPYSMRMQLERAARRRTEAFAAHYCPPALPIAMPQHRSFGGGINESIQESITQPIVGLSRHATHWLTDPVQASRELLRFELGFSDSMLAAARTDWGATVGGFVGEYENAWARDGFDGVSELGGYHFGRVLPYVAMGPELLFEEEVAVGVASRRGAPAGATIPHGPTGEFYSVGYEMRLDPADFGRSDTLHFNRAARALEGDLLSDPAWAASMEEMIPGLGSAVSRVGGRQVPMGWTWHHASEPGVMQLVPRSQHESLLFQKVFHPNGMGGYAHWARPAGAPQRR